MDFRAIVFTISTPFAGSASASAGYINIDSASYEPGTDLTHMFGAGGISIETWKPDPKNGFQPFIKSGVVAQLCSPCAGEVDEQMVFAETGSSYYAFNSKYVGYPLRGDATRAEGNCT
jgi:hypothetical protein